MKQEDSVGDFFDWLNILANGAKIALMEEMKGENNEEIDEQVKAEKERVVSVKQTFFRIIVTNHIPKTSMHGKRRSIQRRIIKHETPLGTLDNTRIIDGNNGQILTPASMWVKSISRKSKMFNFTK